MTEENKKVDESTSKSAEEETKTSEEILYDDDGNEIKQTEEEKVAYEKEAEEKKAEEEKVAAEEKEVAEKKEAEEKAAAEKEKEVEKVVPEKYEIKIPEKSLITDDQLGKIESFAKDRGFSNEEAQAMVESVNTTVENSLNLFQEEQVKQVKELTQVEWPKLAKEDTEIGGDDFEKNCELSKRITTKYGSEEFNKLLVDQGYGNHPEFIRFTTKLGKLMSDDELVFRSSNEERDEKETADVLYDKTE